MINVSFAFMSIEINEKNSLQDLLTVNSLKYHPPIVATQPPISHITVHAQKMLRGLAPHLTFTTCIPPVPHTQYPTFPFPRLSRSASKQFALKRALLIEIKLNQLIALKCAWIA
jgi:hypothetical protein